MTKDRGSRADTAPARKPNLNLLFAIAVCIAILVAFSLWGTGQAVSETYIARRLHIGLGCSDCMGQLALPSDMCDDPIIRSKGLIISEPGLGAWLTPQRRITLLFGSNGRLTGCWVDTLYRLDEHGIELLRRT